MGAKHSSAPPQSTFLGLVLSDEIPILSRRSWETRRKKKHRIRKQRRTGVRTKLHPQVSFIIDLDLATPSPCWRSATERARLRHCRRFGRRVRCALSTHNFSRNPTQLVCPSIKFNIDIIVKHRIELDTVSSLFYCVISTTKSDRRGFRLIGRHTRRYENIPIKNKYN